LAVYTFTCILLHMKTTPPTLYPVVNIEGAKNIAGPASWELHQCACGTAYTHAEWGALPTRRDWRLVGAWLELADCACGATMSIRVADEPRCCQHGAETGEDCGDDTIAATLEPRRVCFAHAYEASLEGRVVRVDPEVRP